MSVRLMKIPLGQLTRSSDNVRRTHASADIVSLAASIEAHGLLQNLSVRRQADGGASSPTRYEVVAGGRRLQAMQLLVRRKKLSKDFVVPCRLLAQNDASGLEVSLAENVQRSSLHPADQFEAFLQLQGQGLGSAEIAARFGLSQHTVEQRLKLAAVSPRLIAEYRADHMTLDQLMAFAVCDDHALQEHVWFEAALFDRSPQAIRRALTKSQVEGSDRRARFIGIEAYEHASGSVVRDLFDNEATYFADSQLLDRLVAEKLKAAAETIAREGWSFVEIQPELDYQALASFGRLSPQKIKLSGKDEKRLASLSKRYDTLVSQIDDHAPQQEIDKLNEMSAEIDELARRMERWSKKSLSQGGVIISLTADGTLQVTRGLTRKEARTSQAHSSRQDEKGNDKNDAVHSDALLRELSAHRTMALREAVAGQAEQALNAIVHSLALAVLFADHSSCVDIRPVILNVTAFGDGLGEAPAAKAFALRHDHWSRELPKVDLVWPWLLDQSVQVKLELLAYLTSCTINAVQLKQGYSSERLASADLLAQAVKLDMAVWFRPTAANYFGRISKPHILKALTGASPSTGAQNLVNLKKEALAVRAEQLVADTAWLPAPLQGLQSEKP